MKSYLIKLLLSNLNSKILLDPVSLIKKRTHLPNEQSYHDFRRDGTLTPLAIELTQPARNDGGATSDLLLKLMFWLMTAYHELIAVSYAREFNALAREGLLNAGGIIETAFSAKKHSMELCCL
ncbi:Lipoxygenase, C-terminal [Dillenia turbinata]|uniref:Lipoxygenase, C-terminal n=1 Tax=Dillenia turbinata TaxID=194707 RepID=A0AAN8ZH28_9MAGN